MIIEIFGLVFSMILGTLGHFLYDFTNKNKIIGFLFAKNENITEHLKLGITPILLWTIVEFLTFHYNNLFFAKFISILFFVFILLFLYFGYKLLLKKNILFLDILIFYISLTLGYMVSIGILSSVGLCYLLNIFGFLGLIFVILFYFIVN